MRFLYLLCLFCLSACTTLTGDTLGSSNVSMVLSETQGGKWLLSATMDTPHQHLIFSSSDGDFREKTWKLVSPGRIESSQGIDYIEFDTPTTRMQFEITPSVGAQRMTRYPFFKFSDGGTIILTKQFYLLPARGKTQIEALAGDLTRWRGYKIDHTLKIATSQPAYINGEQVVYDTLTPFDGENKLVYVGQTGLKEFTHFRGAIDPSLPEWIADNADENIGKIMSSLEALSEKALPGKPGLFLMGDPDSDHFFSYSGVAFPNQILALKVEGTGLRKDAPRIFSGIMFFYAHEIAHLFQHIENAGRTTEKAAWISEGSANLMGYRTIDHAGLARPEFIMKEIRDAYSSCHDILRGSIALGRSAVQSRYYDCGLMIALIADAALPQDDIFSFWNALIDLSEDQDWIYDRELYFTLLSQRGTDPAIVSVLQSMVDAHIETSSFLDGPDLSVDLDVLLSNAGLNPVFGPSGQLMSLDWK